MDLTSSNNKMNFKYKVGDVVDFRYNELKITGVIIKEMMFLDDLTASPGYHVLDPNMDTKHVRQIDIIGLSTPTR
jgi:hypothetical protein